MIRGGRLSFSLAAIGLVAAACGTPTGGPGSETGDPDAAGSPSAGPTGRPTPAGSIDIPFAGWQTDFSKSNVDMSQIVSGGPGKDGIPAIDEPRYESVNAALGEWTPRSPVISLEVDGQARAYPLTILMWHEIANDVLGGTPVVVTFCPLCNTALVFERAIDGVTYDFGTTGNLRYSDLVMYDRQTESWWQQATGQAIVGELTGTELTFLPAQIISLEAFANAHPGGDVLSRQTGFNRDYGRNPYVGYDTVDQNPFLFFGELDGRLPPKERVVTVGQGTAPEGFPYSELRKAGVATGTIDGDAFVVFWAPGTATALGGPLIDQSEDIGATGVFRPIAEGRQLTFERLGGEEAPITDIETGSTWSITGRAVAGDLKGAVLEPVVHGDHFWFAWAAFAPDTKIWMAP